EFPRAAEIQVPGVYLLDISETELPLLYPRYPEIGPLVVGCEYLLYQLYVVRARHCYQPPPVVLIAFLRSSPRVCQFIGLPMRQTAQQSPYVITVVQEGTLYPFFFMCSTWYLVIFSLKSGRSEYIFVMSSTLMPVASR